MCRVEKLPVNITARAWERGQCLVTWWRWRIEFQSNLNFRASLVLFLSSNYVIALGAYMRLRSTLHTCKKFNTESIFRNTTRLHWKTSAIALLSVVNGQHSSVLNATCGIFQGSVLGPTLFAQPCTPMTYQVLLCLALSMYADDTTVYCIGTLLTTQSFL